LSDPKHDETFKVVDRRLFTPEGEFRKDVAEQQDREHETASSVSAAQEARNAAPAKDGGAAAGSSAKPVARDAAPGAPSAAATAKRSPAFENLIRSLGQNAAMLLGGYADPRTGQPMLDLEGAREMIDMLDALREKTMGNLAPEEDTLVIDILGNLKLAFMEMTKAATAAAMQEKVKSRP
jgi:phage protein D